MTKISVPLPSSPFLVPGQVAGTQIVSREWQRFFTLLLEAVGGSTDGPSDALVINGSPFEGDTVAFEALTAAMEAWAQGSANSGRIEGLQSRFDGLDPQIPGPQEFAEIVALLRALQPFGAPPFEIPQRNDITPFAMPPTELGSLEAAKNIGYRVLAAGHDDLVAGTVTINSDYANSANEFSLTAKVVGGIQGILSVGTVIANTSFVVNSSVAGDTSTVSWVILGAIKG